MNALARRLWGPEGLLDVLSSDNGLFFFEFESEKAIEKNIGGALGHGQ